VLATQIVGPSVPSALTPAQVRREFDSLLDAGSQIRPAGSARNHPEKLLSGGYSPRFKLELFDARFYLTNIRYNGHFRFFVAYVIVPEARKHPHIHPRIFYKDSSLVWRSPSHYIHSDGETWIGKGELKFVEVDGVEIEYGAEETTNLPFEIQAALDDLSRRVKHVRRDNRALELVLRSAPDDRFEPYDDFLAPRRRARAKVANRINGGRYIATFARAGDPRSLRFVAGFEPDFRRGVIEVSDLRSRIYGGAVRKFRILSRDRTIQYQFIAAPKQVWIIPPQTTTTEIMSYGLRTLDVEADEDVFVPGFEYHFIDETEDPPVLHSQIPVGFAGAASEVDPSRADASPWLEALPVIRRFRKQVLGRS
jgi:hypothetical protein